MSIVRIGVSTLLMAALLAACGSGYRRGPGVYTGVVVGSPYWAGTRGDGASLPPMGMPTADVDGSAFEGR